MTEQHTSPSRFTFDDQSVAALDVTFETLGRRDLFVRDEWLEMLADRADRTLGKHGLPIHAYVFLPNRVRLLVGAPRRGTRLPWALYVIKRAVSQRIRRDLRAAADPLLRELTVREGAGKYVFRVWAPGPGRVTALRTAPEVADAIDAVHDSPVSRGLCATPADWKWSSCRRYCDPDAPTDRRTPRITLWADAAREVGVEPARI